MKRQRGYTLLEIIIAMAIFGTVLYILVLLMGEMRSYEKRLPVNFLKHPQISAITSRLRADVLDASNLAGDAFPQTFADYEKGDDVFIVQVWSDGSIQTVVWDFRKKDQVTRSQYRVGMLMSEWTARGTGNLVKKFNIEEEDASEWNGIRFKAYDKKGTLAIDQLYIPRVHD
ncbi:MAG TPA: type II secretion system protein [Thermoanaerobaculia bacterium]